MSEAQPMSVRDAEGNAAGAIHPQPPTPAVPKSPKQRSDLVVRLLSAAVLVPAVIYLIILGGLPYLATVVVIILLGQREFYRLIEDKGAQPLVSYGLVAGAALPVVAYVGNEYHATILMTAVLLAVIATYSSVIAPGLTDAEYQRLGEDVGYYVAPTAGAVTTFLMVLWVGRKLDSRYVAGVWVGVVSVILTLGFVFTARPEDRLMYGVAFALRIVAGYGGGLVARRQFSLT
jgi:CDP-diglyceride synthetase